MTRYIWDKESQTFIEPRLRRVQPNPAASDLPTPYIMRDLPPYVSPLGTGVIDGRYARREEMKRHNVREVDPSEWKDPGPKTEAQAQAERKQLEARTEYTMPAKLKKRLMDGN